MSKLPAKYKKEIIGVIVGALSGWAYWYFVGCSSGTCAITSNPLNSTVYGAVMGALAAGLFRKSPEGNSHSEK